MKVKWGNSKSCATSSLIPSRKDHLGTNREVWSFPASGGSFLEQVTQYYPSGLPWWEGRMAETQNRKFNGKEFVEAPAPARILSCGKESFGYIYPNNLYICHT